MNGAMLGSWTGYDDYGAESWLGNIAGVSFSIDFLDLLTTEFGIIETETTIIDSVDEKD